MIALGVLDACAERRLGVPDDVAVAGFDDMAFADVGPLHLTTVHVPRQDMGHRAIELLCARLAENDREPQTVTLPYTIKLRDTA
jgi:LacI family gluconate utilization system Gnt-I transcriptional repressor